MSVSSVGAKGVRTEESAGQEEAAVVQGGTAAGAGKPGAKPSASGPAASANTTARQTEAEARAANASAAAGDAVKVAAESLERSFSNLIIDDADVARAAGALMKLEPTALRAALEQLEAKGLLDDLATRMTPEQRRAFVENLEKKGIVELEPPTSAPKGPGNPPAPARLYDNDVRLPQGLRDVLHAENLDRGAAYYQDYAAYTARFTKAVEATKDAAELQALGAVHKPSPPGESLYRADPAHRRFTTDWAALNGAYASDMGDAPYAITRQLDKFKGNAPVGFSVYAKGKLDESAGNIKAKLEGELEVNGAGVRTAKAETEVGAGKFKGKVSSETDQTGKSKTSYGYEAPFGSVKKTVENDPVKGPKHRVDASVGGSGNGMSASVGVGADSDGKTFVTQKQEMKALGFEFTHEAERGSDGSSSTKVSVETPFGKYESKSAVDAEGKETFEHEVDTAIVGGKLTSVGDVELSIGAGGPRGVARVNVEQGSFGGGVRVKRGESEVEVGVNAQGLRSSDAEAVASDFVSGTSQSIHDPWPELENQVSWKDLTESAMRRALRNGFNEASWNKAIAARGAQAAL